MTPRPPRPPRPPPAMLLLLLLLLRGAHTAPADGQATDAAAEGWSLERMLSEYGDESRRSAPWGVLLAPVPAPGPAANASSSSSAAAASASDAWVGGVSQYYGAGGAAAIDSAAGVLTPRFNALVPGFAATGAGGRGGFASARSLRARANASLADATALRAQHALLNRVETALWAAATLRDNMVTVLGYVLNLPGDHLDAELYTALHHIYQQVRFRRLQVVPLVRKLRDICRASPTSQFKNLFRAMEAVARPPTRGAVRLWLEALDEDEVDLDEMLRPGGGPLVVDFLDGIDPSVVRQLADAPEFPPETEHQADAQTERVAGAVVANAFAAITDGALPLTQTLFALLLQMRPADTVEPQRIEAERLVADCLRQQRVDQAGWRKIVRRAEGARGRGSDDYLRAILWALAESPEVEESLRDAARLVHTYVKPPVATYSNPNYKYTSAVMSRPTLDILYILKAITPSEYPDDVVDAKNRLKFYIENGYLDMEFVVKGFNRFDHVKPINLVIAVLTRIELRLPMLSHEIKSSVKYLKVYLIFKKFLCSLSPQIPRDFLEAPVLLDAFEGPTMPKHIRSLVVRLESILRNERLPVDKLIDGIPVEECIRPRQCILNFYRRVIKGAYISGPAKNLMVSLITSLDINGDPLAPPQQPEYQVKKQRRKKCGNKLWPQIVSQPLQTTPNQHITPKPVASSKLVISSTSTTTRPTTKFKPTTTTKPTTTSKSTSAFTTMSVITTSKATTSKETVPFSPTISPFPTTTVVTTTPSYVLLQHDETVEEETIYPGAPEPLVKFPTLNETELNQKPNYSCPEELLPSTEVGTTEDTIIRPIREFIRVPNLYSWLGYSFRPETYSSKLHLLTAILKRALLSSVVRFNTMLYSSMKQYLTYLHALPRRPQAIQYMVFPNVTEEYELQPANYEEPYKNLPMCTPGTLECDKLHPIRVFLADENIYYKLGPYFKPSLYQTKGSFLKALLQKALRLKYVHQNILLYRVTKQFLMHLNEMHIRPVEVKSTPFPKPDLVKEWEPPNWKRPLTLLPRTVPGTAEHIKMRPLRDFFARPDFWEMLGAEFQPQNYRTKGELLIAVITHALALQHVKDNTLLFAGLNEYLSFLKKSHVSTTSGAPPLAINMQTLVKALPYPETTEEEQHLRQIQELFKNQQFNAVVRPVVAQTKLRTRGAALQLLLQKALEMQKQYQAQGPTLQALQYFKNRVIHDGYGAQAVDYLVPQKMKISVLDLFRAIDHDRLSEDDRQRVKRVINFISYNFNPNKYLSGFQFEKYGTKGDFLKAAFEHMCNLKLVRPQIKDDMTFLTNYIMYQGPGAEPLGVKAEDIA